MIKIKKTFLFSVFMILTVFGSQCYADTTSSEISVRYGGSMTKPSRVYDAEAKTQYTLVTKGMRKVGTEEIITNWRQYRFKHSEIGSIQATVVARCLPSGNKSRLVTPGLDCPGTTLICEKGDKVQITIGGPRNQDYEYVADLIITRDDDEGFADDLEADIAIPQDGAAGLPSSLPSPMLPASITVHPVGGSGSGMFF